MKTKTLLPLLGSLITPSFAALYSADHGDIGIAYEDEGDGPEFFLHYHLGGNAILDGSPVGGGEEGEEFEPSAITTLVPDSTRATMGSVASVEQWNWRFRRFSDLDYSARRSRGCSISRYCY